MNMMTLDLQRQADIAFQANLYDDRNPTRRALHRARRRWVEEALAPLLAADARVLEVGIGCGIFTRHLAGRGARVTAVDINPGFVAGVSDVSGVTPVLADATKALALDAHDVALCSEVLEHVPADGSLALLSTIHNTLKPGGVLVLTTPQRFAVVELMARLLQFRPVLALARTLYGAADELGHINLLTAGSLRRQLAAAGFVVEREARFGFYLPAVAEFGGRPGQRLLAILGRALAPIPGLRALLWTQAYVLRRR